MTLNRRMSNGIEIVPRTFKSKLFILCFKCRRKMCEFIKNEMRHRSEFLGLPDSNKNQCMCETFYIVHEVSRVKVEFIIGTKLHGSKNESLEIFSIFFNSHLYYNG